jgi:hypothetical protein
MTTPSITSKVSQSLDIHGYFPPTVTFNDILIFENLPDPVYILTIQIIAVHGVGKINLFKNLSCRG